MVTCSRSRNANDQIISRTRNPPRLALNYDYEIPSFLRQEFEYIGNLLSEFPEVITPDIQMSCIRAY